MISCAPFGDRLVQHQPALLVGDAATPLHQLDHLIRRCEVQLPRKGSQKPARRRPKQMLSGCFSGCLTCSFVPHDTTLCYLGMSVTCSLNYCYSAQCISVPLHAKVQATPF